MLVIRMGWGCKANCERDLGGRLPFLRFLFGKAKELKPFNWLNTIVFFLRKVFDTR